MAYSFILVFLSFIYFSDLRHHLLDTHDALSFQDHLRIDQNWTFFFSPDKAQASGRPFAEAVKYGFYRIRGNDPASFHLLNVALHTLVSLLIALFCRRLGMDLPVCLVGGLLFLVNVAHFEAVYSISSLDYPLALCCGLLGLYTYVAWRNSPTPGKLFLAILFAILGLLSHPGIAALIPLAFLYSWQQGAKWQTLLRPLLLLSVFLASAIIGLLSITSSETSAWWSLSQYGRQETGSLFTGMLKVLLWFCGRLFTTAHWLPVPIYERQSWELYAGGLLLIALLWLYWRQSGPIRLWIAGLLLSLIPFLLLTEKTILDLPAGPSRYLYFASAGSSVLLAWLSVESFRRVGKPYLLAIPLLLILYSSHRSLADVQAISHYTSSRYYVANDEEEMGIRQLQRAIAHAPEVIPLEDAYSRLSMLVVGIEDDPLPFLEKALNRFPDNLFINTVLAVIEQENPDPEVSDRGLQRFKMVSERAAQEGFPLLENAAFTYNNIGKKYADERQWVRAIRALEHSLSFQPGRPHTQELLVHAYDALAIQLLHQKRFDDAISACTRLLSVDPDHPGAHNNLGWALMQQQRWPEAIEHFQIVLKDHSSSHAAFNLALAHLGLGEDKRARALYARAIEQYGAAEGRRIGAVGDLRRMILRGVHPEIGLMILQEYWPEEVEDKS